MIPNNVPQAWTHALDINTFYGANKSPEPRMLNPTVRVDSFNQRPVKGDLRPLKGPLVVATVPALMRSIYRMGADVADELRYWLAWSGHANVIRGFDADDTTERTYYTGDGTPQWTDNTKALSGSV